MKKTTAVIEKSGPDWQALDTYERVLVRIPSARDSEMKIMTPHTMLVDGKIINVPKHYRKGQIVSKKGEEKKFVTQHYYDLTPDMLGEFIVATVKVVGKTNIFKGEISLLLDIYPDLSGALPEYRLKVGAPTGRFSIPGCDPPQYVGFKEI